MKHTRHTAAALASLLLLTGCDSGTVLEETDSTELPAKTVEVTEIQPSDTAVNLTADLSSPP